MSGSFFDCSYKYANAWYKFPRFFAGKIWQIVLNDIKSSKSHNEFNS